MDAKPQQQPRPVKHTVRLPRFVVRESIGAGEVVKRMTEALGVRPCNSCAERAVTLNRWLNVAPSEPRSDQ
jgi:hypothetical protein